MEAYPAVVLRRDRCGAELVGLAHAHASLDAAAGHPHREPERVVIAAGALGVLRRRLPAELAPPDHERGVEQARSLEIGEQGRDRLVGVAGVELVVFHEVAVGVPVVVVVGAARIELDEPHTPLHEPPREQAAPAEIGRPRVVEAVERLRVLSFAGEIHRLRRVLLHLPGEFVGGDAGGEFGVVAAGESVGRVGLAEGVEHRPLGLERHVVGRREVEDRRALRAQQRALVGRRHVATRPVFRPRNRSAGGIEHDDEAREVFIHAAEAVVDPRAEAGRPRLDLAGVHLQHRRPMDRRVGSHRVEKGDVVHMRRDVREQLAHPLAALAVL